MQDQDIADWLDKLGMSEYAQRFAENRIDFSVLPDLTDQDLEKLGVVLGDRRKMLRAIAKLDYTSAAPSSIPPPAPKAAAPTAPLTTETAGERRHVTVMFCDLADSTGIAARLDAEEWRDLVGAYLDVASTAVTEMGGKVAKKLGDGLMALFGYPVAQENDAERAVRAALAMQRSLAELNRKNEGTGKPALAARIAIDLGPVVVDSTGEIFGDVPNVAARAQALAEPGSVVVTARVQRQMAGLFVVEERGSHELKGVPEPVMLYRIVRASGAGRRASQRHQTRQGDGQLFSVLYGFWVANYVAFNGEVLHELATQFLTRAEKQGATGPLVIGHRLMGTSLLSGGEIADSRAHLDRAIALYDPTEHRPLATRFYVDARVSVLSYRSRALWLLGYPEAALADTDHALRDAREIGQAGTSMSALASASATYFFCGDYNAGAAVLDELITVANKMGSLNWKVAGIVIQGQLFFLTNKASDAVHMLTTGLAAWRSTGAMLFIPLWLSYLASAHTELRQLDDAWRYIGEAMKTIETSKERVYEAEINRVAGEIALKSPEQDAAKAQACFERALAVARQHQAKSWELRAAMSMARLWRDQGKQKEARELLAPVYGWFTEGFDTRDLKEAKSLLDELSS